jgi:hypothetical protein
MRCRSRFGLILAACLSAAPAWADPQLVATLTLRADVDGFGGFSGLELDATGTRLTAVSDKGLVMEGRVQRDAMGTPIDLTGMRFTHLTDTRGDRMPEWRSDAEGLAIDRAGRLFVSFEGDTGRVWRYDAFGAAASPLPGLDAFEALQGNSGLEGLAIAEDGTLYTLPERSGRLERPFPVWRFRGGAWDQPFTIPRRPPHLPVGLDIGPDGRLYLLERHFAGLSFSTRLRRFDLGPTGVSNEVTLLETPGGTHMNLEGLAIWRDDSGAIRATMIADDNLRSFLNTELVEYRLP